MTEHGEKPHSLDKHINEPLSGKGRNEPSRIQDLEVERGRQADETDGLDQEE